MLIGYARVSTLDQNPDLQEDALAAAGCERVYTDKASGKLASRPRLDQVRELLRPGDTLVIWKLDRLGRSLKNLIEWMQWLHEHEVALVSVSEAIDTRTPTGRLVYHLFGALAEFEHALIVERTQAGLTAARARGRMGGRKPKLAPEKRRMVADLYHGGLHTVQEICQLVGVSKPTLYKYVNQAKPAPAPPA